MCIRDRFDADENDEKNDDEKNDDENNSNSTNDEDNQAQGEQEKNKQEESQSGIDGDYDLSEYKMEEQLVDTDSEKQSSENVTQRTNNNINNIEYAVFTNKFDEIAKAETLEESEELAKLRKNLDQQLLQLKNFISKLANKLQRKLLAKQNRSWNFDLEEGLLDNSKLTRIIMDPFNSLSFKHKAKSKDSDYGSQITFYR